MNVATLQVKDNAIVPRLYIAMELSNKDLSVNNLNILRNLLCCLHGC